MHRYDSVVEIVSPCRKVNILVGELRMKLASRRQRADIEFFRNAQGIKIACCDPSCFTGFRVEIIDEFLTIQTA